VFRTCLAKLTGYLLTISHFTLGFCLVFKGQLIQTFRLLKALLMMRINRSGALKATEPTLAQKESLMQH
ncbi:hypothetical protein, partial [Salisediminibacterium halotolerans]|uniref:hypothetical protein n=1 Tax=Salisediminibacterium halotolerans TaxID=517425 RepID=UPI001A7E4BF8